MQTRTLNNPSLTVSQRMVYSFKLLMLACLVALLSACSTANIND